MGKVIDITDKLNFEESPKLKIRDIEVTVDDGAMTMLKVLNFVSDDEAGPEKLQEAYELLFSEEDRQKLDTLKLNFVDLNTVIKYAIDAITGGEDETKE